MKNRTGHIPEKVVAVSLPEKESTGDGQSRSHWSFKSPSNITDGFDSYTAATTFVVPADSVKMVDSARKWGLRFCKGYDEKTVPNTPITDLRWVGIDGRTEGGVAYKVVTPQGWLVDLREDVLLAILHAGKIENKTGHSGSGTYFTAEFVWVQLGSQSRLVMVGSELHQEVLESMERTEQKEIQQSEIASGGLYETRQGKRFLVLGKDPKRGFLTMEVFGYRNSPSEHLVHSMKTLACVEPGLPSGFNYTKKLTVIRKLDDVSVPEDVVDRYNKKAKMVYPRTWR